MRKDECESLCIPTSLPVGRVFMESTKCNEGHRIMYKLPPRFQSSEKFLLKHLRVDN